MLVFSTLAPLAFDSRATVRITGCETAPCGRRMPASPSIVSTSPPTGRTTIAAPFVDRAPNGKLDGATLGHTALSPTTIACTPDAEFWLANEAASPRSV